MLSLASCGGSRNVINSEEDSCNGYPDPQSSAYVLPYEVGSAYEVIQGNCAPKGGVWSHFDTMKYAYDFGMPIGTPILASRAGTVIFVGKNLSTTIITRGKAMPWSFCTRTIP